MMNEAIWAARLVVAAVFIAAAWAKLDDRAGTRQAVQEFGVPERFATAAGWALPVVELLVAAAVLPAASAVAGCLAVLIVLAVFSAGIANLLRKGRHPSCSCFGAASNAPISGWTLARNAAIAALAGLASWGSWTHPGLPSVLPVQLAVGVAVAVALAAMQLRQGAELSALRRELAESRRQGPATEGLALGVVAPAFDLPGTDGERGTLADSLKQGRPVLLVFLHPKCGPCRSVAAELAKWGEHGPGSLTVVPIGSGDVGHNAEWAGEHGLARMLVQDDREVLARYNLRGTPTAVLVDTSGRIASLYAGGPAAVARLLNESTPTPART